jgi:hypothetical protein
VGLQRVGGDHGAGEVEASSSGGEGGNLTRRTGLAHQVVATAAEQALWAGNDTTVTQEPVSPTRRSCHACHAVMKMVERSIAWLVADGCRRVLYRGIVRNELWWSLRVAAVNLRRLLALGLARCDGVWVLA